MKTKDILKEMIRVYDTPLIRLITNLNGQDGQEVLRVYSGPLRQLLTNLAGENGEEVLIELKKFNRKEPCYVKTSLTLESKMNFRKKKSILRCISQGKNLSIRPLDGSRLICDDATTFKFISFDFFNFDLTNVGVVTAETLVRVHEIIGNGTFMDIFRALTGNWNQNWLSQDQIIKFCEIFPDWLKKDGNVTMFLAKKNENEPIDETYPQNNLVVIDVRVLIEGLHVRVHRLEDTYGWFGKYLNRVVSPQLMPPVV